MDIDECLKKVGGYRRYSLAAMFVMGGSAMFTITSQLLLFVFVGRTSMHHCKLSDGALLNESIPLNEETDAPETCSMYAGNATNITTSCDHGWTFNNPDGDFTIVNEWDLVCERDILPEISMVVFGIGGMLGECFGNILADKLGRKWVHFTGFIIVVVAGCSASFAKSFEAYTLLICIASIGNSTCVAATLTHIFEVFDSKRRAFVGVGIQFFWLSGYLYVGLMGYLLRYWRHLQLALSLTALIGLFNVVFPESPMWLVANHKLKRANATLLHIARWNGVRIEGPLLMAPEKEMHHLMNQKEEDNDVEKKPPEEDTNITRSKSPPEETGQENLFDLFRWPLLCRFTLISSSMWFANVLVYFFIILSTPALMGDFYVNFLIGALVELPAYIVAMIVVKYGRRIPTVVFLIMASVSLIALAFIPQSDSMTYVIMAVAMCGKFSITASFAIMVLYTRELFPTNLRSTSYGVSKILGRLGLLVAPMASFTAKSMPWLPNLMLGLIALVVALVCLLLPETKDWPLPMSIADVYRYTRGEFPSRGRQSPLND